MAPIARHRPSAAIVRREPTAPGSSRNSGELGPELIPPPTRRHFRQPPGCRPSSTTSKAPGDTPHLGNSVISHSERPAYSVPAWSAPDSRYSARHASEKSSERRRTGGYGRLPTLSDLRSPGLVRQLVAGTGPLQSHRRGHQCSAADAHVQRAAEHRPRATHSLPGPFRELRSAASRVRLGGSSPTGSRPPRGTAGSAQDAPGGGSPMRALVELGHRRTVGLGGGRAGRIRSCSRRPQSSTSDTLMPVERIPVGAGFAVVARRSSIGTVPRGSISDTGAWPSAARTSPGPSCHGPGRTTGS